MLLRQTELVGISLLVLPQVGEGKAKIKEKGAKRQVRKRCCCYDNSLHIYGEIWHWGRAGDMGHHTTTIFQEIKLFIFQQCARQHQPPKEQAVRKEKAKGKKRGDYNSDICLIDWVSFPVLGKKRQQSQSRPPFTREREGGAP